jgi:hypothetical protein
VVTGSPSFTRCMATGESRAYRATGLGAACTEIECCSQGSLPTPPRCTSAALAIRSSTLASRYRCEGKLPCDVRSEPTSSDAEPEHGNQRILVYMQDKTAGRHTHCTYASEGCLVDAVMTIDACVARNRLKTHSARNVGLTRPWPLSIHVIRHADYSIKLVHCLACQRQTQANQLPHCMLTGHSGAALACGGWHVHAHTAPPTAFVEHNSACHLL